MKTSILNLSDLNLPKDFIFKPIMEVSGPTCTICSDCCLCETGGV